MAMKHLASLNLLSLYKINIKFILTSEATKWGQSRDFCNSQLCANIFFYSQGEDKLGESAA